MAEYLVTWQIDIDADSPVAAAIYADDVLRDPESAPFTMTVKDQETGTESVVDLEQVSAGDRRRILEIMRGSP